MFPLTFVMENLINYANFRDTHLDDNLMQWYPEEVYPGFFCTQISDLGSDSENGVKFQWLTLILVPTVESINST